MIHHFLGGFSTDRMTGQSRGFGYITYEDLAAAEAAISNSANNVIDGKWVIALEGKVCRSNVDRLM